jgi:hypothetical protein
MGLEKTNIFLLFSRLLGIFMEICDEKTVEILSNIKNNEEFNDANEANNEKTINISSTAFSSSENSPIKYDNINKENENIDFIKDKFNPSYSLCKPQLQNFNPFPFVISDDGNGINHEEEYDLSSSKNYFFSPLSSPFPSPIIHENISISSFNSSYPSNLSEDNLNSLFHYYNKSLISEISNENDANNTESIFSSYSNSSTYKENIILNNSLETSVLFPHSLNLQLRNNSPYNLSSQLCNSFPFLLNSFFQSSNENNQSYKQEDNSSEQKNENEKEFENDEEEKPKRKGSFIPIDAKEEGMENTRLCRNPECVNILDPSLFIYYLFK